MKPVEPHELASVWHWAKAGVEQVLREQGQRIIAEDVYCAIRTGQAWMFTVEDVGFIVLQRHADVDGSGVLFVWLMWGEAQQMVEHQGELLEELNDMAKRAKCGVVRMWSNRKGWERVGWNLKQYVYEREVM